MDNLQKSLVPISEAARYLGVSAMTLRRWHEDGSFPPTFISPGGHRYYALGDLERRTKGLFALAQSWATAERPAALPLEFYCSTSDRFKTRHARMAHALGDVPAYHAIAPLLSAASGEIGNNSFDHNLGVWHDVIGVLFAYDAGKHLIVLADRGVGVLATLKRVRPNLRTHEEALQTAFTEVVTGRAPEHRGNGLKYVREAMRKAGADLRFQSGDAVLTIRAGDDDIHLKKTDQAIRGCLAAIAFPRAEKI